MFNLKYNRIPKITIAASMILFVTNCSKDQNSFLPYREINLRISLINLNHLTIPGNSILFTTYGFKGVIVTCVDPNSGNYAAFDACCPYETDYSGVVELEPVKGLNTPNMVYSSGFTGKCNKCGSEFSLMGNGQPVKGPAIHYLQSYHISVGSGNLTVTN